MTTAKIAVVHDGVFSVYRSNGAFQFSLVTPDTGEADSGEIGGNPRAPMNGTIVALLATTGEMVAADAHCCSAKHP